MSASGKVVMPEHSSLTFKNVQESSFKETPGHGSSLPIGNRTSVSFQRDQSESPSSHEIEWDFNGPLLNGPLPSDITFDNSSPIVFKTAERRKLVQQDDALWQRRDELLSIAESHIDRTNAPGFRAMVLYSERVFKYQLDHLDAALVAYPVQLSEDEVGYCFDLRKYGSVIDCMEKIAIKRSGVLERYSLPAPSIPSLPKEWTSDSLWSLQDIEMLCILLWKTSYHSIGT
ncbi:hypothetical protein K439DRAFT_1615187 [Ramaria rubella]|nr:hypothetical protein K439DRAFT_1615187 [Ramaria rubella]